MTLAGNAADCGWRSPGLDPGRQRNLEDHGVDFRLAALIFTGPVLEAKDERDDYGEIRYRALGRVGDEYFVLAYTWRGANRRMISAWKVGEHGKERYEAVLAERPPKDG